MKLFDDLTGCGPPEANEKAFAELSTFKIPFPLYSVRGYFADGCVAGCFGILYFPANNNRTFVFRRYTTYWGVVASMKHKGCQEWRFDGYEALRAFCDEVIGCYGSLARVDRCPGVVQLQTLRLVA